MIQDTIGRIEERVKNAASVPDETKAELARLLATLKAEVGQISESQPDKAQSIAGFAAVSAHEATRADRNPELLELSLKGLSSTVDEFEKTHPKLAQIVNSISTTLSNLGI